MTEKTYGTALASLRQALEHKRPDPNFATMRDAQKGVVARFQPSFRNPDSLDAQTLRDFLVLKNNKHWSGLHRLGGRLTKDMGAMRTALGLLLRDDMPLAQRIDSARQLVDGLGPAIATAILLVAEPGTYGVLNNTSEAGAKRFGLLPPGWTTMSVGERCAHFNQLLTRLAQDLDVDLWTLDGLWWAVGAAADVPSVPALMNPVLQALGELPDAQGRLEEINEKVCDLAGVSAAAREILHGSTDMSLVDYRIAWALTYLRAYGATENVARGVWRLGSGFRGRTVEPSEVVREYRSKKTDKTPALEGVLRDWLETAQDDERTREASETAARALIEGNLGRLTETQLRAFMRHMNTCRSSSGAVAFNRFSPAFVGNNANNLAGALPRLNPLIEELWRAPEAALPAVFDRFLDEAPPGAGRSFPSAVLYLRAPDRFAVWTDWLDRALERVIGTSAHERTGAGYISYCKDIHGFLDRYEISAPLHDKALWVLAEATPPDDDEGGSGPEPEPTVATICERTFLDAAFFEVLDRHLEDKKQLILQGPPGTGKTHVAMEYARFLTRHGGDVTTVQLHPSYGYEDFVEGLRPVVERGQLQYRVEPGIFRTLCDKARADPNKQARYVLVVDEINRGNLPRIFGELLFLLERRSESVTLPYSKQTFSVPENVVVIGTMNSADRSIALLDLALRRRFHFVTLAPNEAVLRSWLEAAGRPLWVADLLACLNSELVAAGVDTRRLVGHSHFMVTGIDDDVLARVWEGTIEPMLEELFFSQPKALEALSFERLSKKARAMDGG
jgi:PAS domain-containing protein